MEPARKWRWWWRWGGMLRGGRGQGVHQTPPTLGLSPGLPVDSQLAGPCSLTLAVWLSGTRSRQGLKKQVIITLVPASAATWQLCPGDHLGQRLRQVQVPSRGHILEKALRVNSSGLLLLTLHVSVCVGGRVA